MVLLIQHVHPPALHHEGARSVATERCGPTLGARLRRHRILTGIPSWIRIPAEPSFGGGRIRLFDLAGFQRTRLGRDTLLGLVLVPVSLVFIFGGTYAGGRIVYGTITQPYFLGGLPLPAARVLLFAIAHALMDVATVLIPLLKA